MDIGRKTRKTVKRKFMLAKIPVIIERKLVEKSFLLPRLYIYLVALQLPSAILTQSSYNF